MRYVDRLVNALFLKDQEGIVFYPYGVVGCGYHISPIEENNVKKFLTAYYKIFLLISLLFILFLKIWTLWVLLIIALPWYHIRMRRLLMGATRVEGLSFQERTMRLALAHGLRTNLVLLGMAILMTGAAIFCLFLPDTKARIAGILGTAFFGACLWQSIVSVKHSLYVRQAKHNGP